MGRPKGSKNKKFGRKRNVWRRSGYVPNAKKFGIAKSLGYAGFHCFKEKSIGTLSISPETGTTNNFKLDDLRINNLGLTNNQWMFNINQVKQWEQYQALFQQFRITGVKIKIYPGITQSMDGQTTDGGNVTTYSGRSIPNLVYKFDPNDNIAWSNFVECMTSDPKIVQTNRPLSLYMKPKLMVADYQTSNIQNDNVITDSVKWCNFDKVNAQTGDPATPPPYTYTGLDMGCMNCDGRQTMNFVITYYFQCKTPQ